MSIALQGIGPLLKRFSVKCIVNDEEKESDIYVDEDFSQDSVVKRAYGLDYALAEYTGINVMKCYFGRKLQVDDVVHYNDKKYGVLHTKKLGGQYLECILWEDDFVRDLTFLPVLVEKASVNKVIFSESGLNSKGRLMSILGAGSPGIPKDFLPEDYNDQMEKTHRITIPYNEEFAAVAKGWSILCEGKVFYVISFFNNNEQNKWLVYDCCLRNISAKSI